MKILVITPDFGIRGTQRVAENFIRGYTEGGHDVAVFPFDDDGPRRAAVLHAGATIVADVGQATYDLVHVHRSGVESPRETQLLRRVRPRARVVLETNVFARYDPSVEGLIDLHGHLTRVGLYRWQCLSPKGTKGIPFVLPNAVDFTAFSPIPRRERASVRQSLDLPAEAPIVGRIGKTDRRLFGSLGRLLGKHPELHVASVGDHTLSASLARSFPQRFHTLDATSDDAKLARYYQAFDVLTHFSPNGESFGMVLAEAIACGVPVVMPLRPHRDLGGAEVIQHGQGGFLCGTSHDLEGAVERLLAGTAEPLDLETARLRLLRQCDHRAVARRALDAAEMFMNRSSLGDVRRALGEETSADDVATLLGSTLGSAPLYERALHAVAHHPWGTALVRSVKRLRSPPRG